MRYKGYAGRILRINLTTEELKEQEPTEGLVRSYVGGEGWGARILWEEMKPGIAPFDPANKIVLSVGPLQGTKCPSASRICVATKSPLTGGFTRSLCGGNFAHEIKRAGYDAIIIEGRAERPIYVWIDNRRVKIREADFIWGMNTRDTEKYVRDYTDQYAQVICIGPAGERLVRFSCMISGMGAFGRGGSGAVMGSKNLKAIAVRGTREVEVAYPERFKAAVNEAYANFAKQKELARNWRRYGTWAGVDRIESQGNWPTRNWQTGTFKEAQDTLYSVVWRKKFARKDIACARCPVYCRKITYVSSGPFEGVSSEGPEYETIWAFGPQCGNYNPEAIVAADRLCDELGLDTISCGSAVGFAIELFEKGIITEKELDGLQLTWGNYAAMVEMIRRIGKRIGFGSILAEGVARAAQTIGKGASYYAIHVKGLELPAYDPRGQFGMGLNYATANRGGCHTTGYTAYDEVGNIGFLTERKGELVFKKQNEACVRNSAIICSFGRWGTGPVLRKLLKFSTGISFPLTVVGERIYNLERAFNVREGFSRRDDSLPKRLLEEPLPEGPAKGKVVPLEPMLNEYYELRGWNKETGFPNRHKLEELGLNDVVDELESISE